MAKFKKNETVFTVYDSAREIEFEEIREHCEINEMEVPEEYTHEAYMVECDIRDMEGLDFDANLKRCKALDVPCMVTGDLGLWDGITSVVHLAFDSVKDAIDACVGRSINDIDLVYNKGVLELQCHHHDGTNCFNIRKLSKRGKMEVEKKRYSCKDYDPKDWWFMQFKPEEIF